MIMHADKSENVKISILYAEREKTGVCNRINAYFG